MFRASLCPSSGEQEQDLLKLNVEMPGCAGCGCVEPGVGSVHFLKAVVRLQYCVERHVDMSLHTIQHAERMNVCCRITTHEESNFNQ
jgi:hypothetical protein